MSIIGARLGKVERLAAGARASAKALRKQLDAIQARLDAQQATLGTAYFACALANITILDQNMLVTAGKTIDGVDISTLSTVVADIAALDTRLDTAESEIDAIQADITDLSTFAANTGYDYIDADSFDNRDARTRGYSNAKAFIQATDAATSRYHTTWLVPRTITASTNLTIKLHWLVAAAGGTNGQDVVWRLSTAFTANSELTSTSAATLDTTVDTPSATAETFYITTLTTTLSGAVAGDNMTLNIDRRGSDAADTLTATAGFVGVEITWTPDYA